jgi:hypothetical protein
MKPVLIESLERVAAIDINRVEIVIDDDQPDKVELYILDNSGRRIEGGTFSRSDFMDAILKFYRENY